VDKELRAADEQRDSGKEGSLMSISFEEIAQWANVDIEELEKRKSPIVQKIRGLPDKIRLKEIEDFMTTERLPFMRRTFQYYQVEGYLPPLEKRAKNLAWYSPDHVYAYLVIEELKNSLPLNMVKKLLNLTEQMKMDWGRQLEMVHIMKEYSKVVLGNVAEGTMQVVRRDLNEELDEGQFSPADKETYIRCISTFTLIMTTSAYLSQWRTEILDGKLAQALNELDSSSSLEAIRLISEKLGTVNE